MYKVSSHSNHLLVKAGRPRTFPVVGTSNNIEPSSKRSSTSSHDGGSPTGQGPGSQSPEIMTSPKPVFTKKSPTKQNYKNGGGQSPQLTQNYEDMLKFVQSSWHQVMQEFDAARGQGNKKVAYYDRTLNSNNNNVLADFKPLDLEEWAVNRMIQKMDMERSITN